MNICVYGASSDSIDEIYFERTYELGREMAKRGHSLIFGGGTKGLMGACARGVHENGGQVIGVAPKFFDMPGILYQECDEFIYTKDMHERKSTFENLADAYIVTPGGNGTYEEFFETFTLKQLGQLKGPIAIFNIDGYFDPLKELIEHSLEKGFMREISRSLCVFFDDIDEMLDYIENDDTPLLDIRLTKC